MPKKSAKSLDSKIQNTDGMEVLENVQLLVRVYNSPAFFNRVQENLYIVSVSLELLLDQLTWN